MNTDYENWIEDHIEEYEFLKSVEWIEKQYPKVYEQFMDDCREHCEGMKDAYYRYAYGGGKVPVPCCKYCNENDGNGICLKEVNNLDPSLIPSCGIPIEDDGLCECYTWCGDWEED